MKEVNFYRELPENYKEVYVIDAKKVSTAIEFSVLSVLMMIIPMIIGMVILFYNYSAGEVFGDHVILINFVLIGLMLLYIVLHELTHGFVYKIMTHEKLTFGLTLTAAYCGVPNLYVTRKTAILSILAPFVVYSILFVSLMIFVPILYVKYLSLFLFSLHFGGCIGDLYGACFLIFKYRNKKMLMNDTGPKQTFYILNDE